MRLDGVHLLAVFGGLSQHWRTAILIGLIIVTSVVAVLLLCHESCLVKRAAVAFGGTLVGMVCLGAWVGRP